MSLGDPRGIGPEVTAAALADPRVRGVAEFRVIGPEGLASSGAPRASGSGVAFESVGRWTRGGPADAGRLALAAIDRGIDLALAGEVDGLVTAPISKGAMAAAGAPCPGHTEILMERCGVRDVTMIMAAEETPLGGPLRIVLLTTHLPLREVPRCLSVELVERRASIAARALRDWWGISLPRLAFAGVNPHASEGGLFGDEEDRILAPAAERLAAAGEARVEGIFPADTVFRRCLEGAADAVVVPYHDVGLAVLKTVARGKGVNVTAGLPFPRTSPDHGTAFDIAGTGAADPSSMVEAMLQCARFCRAVKSGHA